MADKNFNKKLPKKCEYCIYGKGSSYSDEILCLKKGVTNANDSCKKYKYDPLKRVPKRPKLADNYKSEDFEI